MSISVMRFGVAVGEHFRSSSLPVLPVLRASGTGRRGSNPLRTRSGRIWYSSGGKPPSGTVRPYSIVVLAMDGCAYSQCLRCFHAIPNEANTRAPMLRCLPLGTSVLFLVLFNVILRRYCSFVTWHFPQKTRDKIALMLCRAVS